MELLYNDNATMEFTRNIHEDDEIMRLILQKIYPLTERYNTICSMNQIDNMHNDCLDKLTADIDDYLNSGYTYSKILNKFLCTSLIKRSNQTIVSVINDIWYIDNKMEINDIPVKIPNRDKILSEITINDDDTISLEIDVVQNASNTDIALPIWCHMFSNNMISGYDVLFEQAIYAEDKYQFQMHVKYVDKTIDGIYNFTLKLIVGFEDSERLLNFIYGERTYKFTYNPQTNNIVWLLPENETEIMFPPPDNKIIQDFMPLENSPRQISYSDDSYIRDSSDIFDKSPYNAFQIKIPIDIIDQILMCNM